MFWWEHFLVVIVEGRRNRFIQEGSKEQFGSRISLVVLLMSAPRLFSWPHKRTLFRFRIVTDSVLELLKLD
jgi:hypothetical protein